MATGRSIQLTKQIGEYLVAAELCRRGLIATTFTGNVPEFDILAINDKYETIPVQVKAIRGSSWQFDARRYIEIEIENGVQKVTGKTKPPYKNLIHVFVKLKGQGQDEFFIFGIEDLQDIIYRHYQENLKKQQGRRPKNPESTHAAIGPKDLIQFKDKWETIRYVE